MTVTTTMPGVQVYSGNFLTDRAGKYGATYHKRDAICLETQYYPNAMACEAFEKPILRARDIYHHTTSFAFSIR
jgi:aldose 1-epimerase